MATIRILPLLVSAALLAACAERPPLAVPPGTTPDAPDPGYAKVECRADLAALTVACGGPAGTAPGVRANIYGGQGQYVRLTSTNVAYNAGTGIFSADVSLTNLLPFPLGTTDRLNPDSGGVKVFFATGPTATGGSGAVEVENPDGYGVLTASNQPFFKYAGNILPSQTRAAKSWRFQVDAGVTTFAFTLLVQAEVPPAAMFIVSPSRRIVNNVLIPDTVTTDTVDVVVSAAEPSQVTSVRVTDGSITRQLAYAGGHRWSVRFPLGGRPSGNVFLTMTAVAPTDSMSLNTAIVYDVRPVLTLTLPEEGTVARPGVRIAGSCTGYHTCTVKPQVQQTVLFTATGSFDQTPSLAAWEGTTQILYVNALSGMDAAQAKRNLWIESTPHWAEFASAGSRMVMADSAAVFYRDTSFTTGNTRLALDDLVHGTTAQVYPAADSLAVESAGITPTGVLFALNRPGYREAFVFEYRNGTLTSLGTANKSSFQARGGYALWVPYRSTTLLRRDAVNGVTDTVTTRTAGGVLGSNGDVAYSDSGVWRYRGGTATRLVAAGRAGPSDGDQVLYVPLTPSGYYGLGVTDGTRDTVFFESTVSAATINNGWIAFLSSRIVSRAPDGFMRFVSAGPATLLGLGAAGEVMYAENGRRYYTVPPYSSRVDIGKDWGASGPVRFEGSTGYVLLGRTAFRIVP